MNGYDFQSKLSDVLISNLKPSFTSFDVEIWNFLWDESLCSGKTSAAKMAD